MLSGGVYPLVSEEPDGELQLKSPKKSTDIAFLYLRPWPKNRHAARATFPHRKFLPDFCRTFDGLFIRFAPFCSFRQQKAKTPQNRDSEAKKAKKMVHPTRFELMTFYSGGRRSIQLSYGCPYHYILNIVPVCNF